LPWEQSTTSSAVPCKKTVIRIDAWNFLVGSNKKWPNGNKKAERDYITQNKVHLHSLNMQWCALQVLEQASINGWFTRNSLRAHHCNYPPPPNFKPWAYKKNVASQ
jgi:hypothetical protein